MSPAGAAPNVPVVAPAPTCSASARALAASRLITSTVCPALAARPPIAAAMPPEPMMLIVLMCSLLVSWVVLVLPSNHARHITCKKQVNNGILLAIMQAMLRSSHEDDI